MLLPVSSKQLFTSILCLFPEKFPFKSLCLWRIGAVVFSRIEVVLLSEWQLVLSGWYTCKFIVVRLFDAIFRFVEIIVFKILQQCSTDRLHADCKSQQY